MLFIFPLALVASQFPEVPTKPLPPPPCFKQTLKTVIAKVPGWTNQPAAPLCTAEEEACRAGDNAACLRAAREGFSAGSQWKSALFGHLAKDDPDPEMDPKGAEAARAADLAILEPIDGSAVTRSFLAVACSRGEASACVDWTKKWRVKISEKVAFSAVAVGWTARGCELAKRANRPDAPMLCAEAQSSNTKLAAVIKDPPKKRSDGDEDIPWLLELMKRPGRDLHGVDFSNRRLAGADFSLYNLRGANFRGAFLRGARFTNADLDGAIFEDAQTVGFGFWTGARLSNVKAKGSNLGSVGDAATLENADFSGATVTGNFSRATLAGLNLSNAVFDGRMGDADVNGVKLVGIWFRAGADLTAARFQGADLHGATFDCQVDSIDLRKANLQGAKAIGKSFFRAHLEGANFTNANLKKAWFGAGAYLSGAIFDGANLTGARFEGTQLRGVSFKNAILCHTVGFRTGDGANTEGAQTVFGCPPL